MRGPLLVGPADADERVARRWGGRALGLLARHAPDAASLAAALAGTGVDGAAVAGVHGELLHLLRTDPLGEVRFDLAAVPGGGEGLEGAAAAGVATARLAGLRVREERAPAVVGVRCALGGPGGPDGPGDAGPEELLERWAAAVVATAERGADAPEVELGSLPERVVVALAGEARRGGAALVRRAAAALGGGVDVLVEVEAEVARGAPPPVPDDADGRAVRAAWAEHLRLLVAARDRGAAPGYEVHPAHLVSGHLGELLLGAG